MVTESRIAWVRMVGKDGGWEDASLGVARRIRQLWDMPKAEAEGHSVAYSEGFGHQASVLVQARLSAVTLHAFSSLVPILDTE